ncbi:hypothetical protein [Streptomyces sp. NPDC048057]|uniref:hypothetical protein n=1 Tax=Streptomyces sp. NPDC048057 TaxID=3155628 RepID=UPI00340C63FB
MPAPLATAGRIAIAAASTALALPLLTGTATAVERRPPADRGDATAPLASKPEGPIESSLSVGATGILGAAGAVYIIRRHRNRR